MPHTADQELEKQWARLIRWCQTRAPATVAGVNPPADPTVARAVETVTGQTWTPELRAWFTLHNGSDQGYAFPQIMPGYRPMTLAEIDADWHSLVRIWAETTAELENLDGHRLTDAAAGTIAFTYLPSFIPIAADDTNCRLVIDTRGGDLRGCVTEFAGESVDEGTMSWPSITAMLRDVADAVENHSPLKGRIPTIENGYLDWDLP